MGPSVNQEEYTINLIKGLKKVSKNDPFDQYLINKEVKPKPYVALTDEQGTTVTGEISVEESLAKMRQTSRAAYMAMASERTNYATSKSHAKSPASIDF